MVPAHASLVNAVHGVVDQQLPRGAFEACTCAPGDIVVYGLLRMTVGLGLTAEKEYDGVDLSIHRIGATPKREVNG